MVAAELLQPTAFLCRSDVGAVTLKASDCGHASSSLLRSAEYHGTIRTLATSICARITIAVAVSAPETVDVLTPVWLSHHLKLRASLALARRPNCAQITQYDRKGVFSRPVRQIMAVITAMLTFLPLPLNARDCAYSQVR